MSRRVAVIIEDNPDVRAMVAMKLTSAGFVVHEAADGMAGLSTVQLVEPDIVILDMMMPRISGLEVLERLRSDSSIDQIPVILLTARAQDEAVRSGFAAGASDYIIKPFSPRELVERIEKLLDPDVVAVADHIGAPEPDSGVHG